MEDDLYRYSTKKYSDSLVEQGNIRIGTLYDFRREELGRGIADKSEGTKSIFHDVDFADTSEMPVGIHPDFQALADLGLNTQSRSGAINNVSAIKHFDSPDCFMLCISSNKSRKTMAEFEGADSCVQITESKFFDAISIALNRIVAHPLPNPKQA